MTVKSYQRDVSLLLVNNVFDYIALRHTVERRSAVGELNSINCRGYSSVNKMYIINWKVLQRKSSWSIPSFYHIELASTDWKKIVNTYIGRVGVRAKNRHTLLSTTSRIHIGDWTQTYISALDRDKLQASRPDRCTLKSKSPDVH
jgi:hypothetical protein